ncbi:MULTISPECIES: Sir2 silent information regulator family NAD-dependent deacetylase [unclassified Actinomyces]|uniref:SIR2 family NAD-dependent protein deacylase n=1 Tax=unclassified Actinomyces TaxID=2609248 RepID=UPI002017E969|nr:MULTISPECIES: Sir2 silent information regulator family NAD-dependent deacetylase [unclassified Actinomyces]MCL3778176.1 Sir2 silent information regulator family NAD-dependent deacetylase [Actinomyces sp. AC-20-1]MCL3790036.1 Sir2 silent information regulator family NAD-dependent deacetylase [Actinomyces sp. 187325]MCL3792725.1 Sir2 silent information regulator family NAD-dependent deacetylase [Actinomyces sp. 186855]MCL3793604.1 Sir2 silent information regulator family NAD-dependent deacetyl
MTDTGLDQAVAELAHALEQADAVVVGAGSGLSTAAGLTYSGERFERLFADLIDRYGLRDMYSAGFIPFPAPEEQWAYWSRHIWCNRYAPAPKDTYRTLLAVLDGRDFFVLTTNVDHQLQLAGFPKDRLFYTQGDYGLWQCSKPCHHRTYDNRETVRQMIEAQGFSIAEDGALVLPEGDLLMTVPHELVPHCPVCGRPMTMNLRADDTFVEDTGWHEAASRYRQFLQAHGQNTVLYLELGVGANTPAIIKYPFWRSTYANPLAVYACVNLGETGAPAQIRDRSILVDADIDQVLSGLAAAVGKDHLHDSRP